MTLSLHQPVAGRYKLFKPHLASERPATTLKNRISGAAFYLNNMTKTKKCTKCEERKKLTEFSKKTANKDGLQYNCKVCMKARCYSWREENADRHRKNERRYHRARRKADPSFRIERNMRTRLYCALKGKNKAATTMELVGCDHDYLWDHLIAQFAEGMTVENYGKWHVDHIRPCASFDLEDEEQQRECFHYTNLQPLWAIDNIKKGDKYDG